MALPLKQLRVEQRVVSVLLKTVLLKDRVEVFTRGVVLLVLWAGQLVACLKLRDELLERVRILLGEESLLLGHLLVLQLVTELDSMDCNHGDSQSEPLGGEQNLR